MSEVPLHLAACDEGDLRGVSPHSRHLAVEESGHATHPRACLLRVRGQGPGSRVQGSGFKVQGSGFRVQGSGCRVKGSGCRVQGAGVRGQG